MMTLKQFRSRRKITQKELANAVGITPTTLSKYENGEWLINQVVIDRIRELYGVEIRPLLRTTKRAKRTWQKRN